MLSDAKIADARLSGEINITPYEENHLNPASYDLTLDPRIRAARTSTIALDMREVASNYTYPKTISSDAGFVLYPGQFILASTTERITLSDRYAARIEGKSSLGRVGLAVHITAGFFDPGWDGECTLEIINHLPQPIRLWSGMRIAQMAFFKIKGNVNVPYGKAGHYQSQMGPTESKYKMAYRNPRGDLACRRCDSDTCPGRESWGLCTTIVNGRVASERPLMY